MTTDSSWYKTDYEQHRAEILLRIGSRQRLLYFSLIAAGGIGAFLGGVYNQWAAWLAPFSFFAAFLFATVVLVYLHHDIMLAYIAQYIERSIRLQDATIPQECLTWERYLLARRTINNKEWLLHAGLAFSRFTPVLLISAAFFAGGCWAFGAKGLTWVLALLGVLSMLACLAAYAAIACSIRVLFRENEHLRALSLKPRKTAAKPGPEGAE